MKPYATPLAGTSGVHLSAEDVVRFERVATEFVSPSEDVTSSRWQRSVLGLLIDLVGAERGYAMNPCDLSSAVTLVNHDETWLKR